MRGVLAERDLPQAGRHLKGVGGGADLEAPLRTAAQPISLLTWPSLPFVNWSPQPLSSACSNLPLALWKNPVPVPTAFLLQGYGVGGG